ncbi:MAG: aroK [Proteobacteria bacterium]|nr:aroK [Pseudomonadota bacterium]
MTEVAWVATRSSPAGSQSSNIAQSSSDRQTHLLREAPDDFAPLSQDGMMDTVNRPSCRMKFNGNIFLIGPMGAGKTTIGRLLSKALSISFHDSDKEIEQRTGVSIPMIFEYEGEPGFRKRESEVLTVLTQNSPIILATGGGSVLLESNREVLRQRGFVVYLQCAVEKQLERTHKDSNRPLLKTENPRARLEELLAVRDPIYRSVAHFTVDTGRYSSRSAVRQILRAYNRARQAPRDA